MAARSPTDMRTAFTGVSGGALSPRCIAVALMETWAWRAWLVDSFAMLSASEAARVQRRRSTADRDALALAYALHRLLLGQFLGLDPINVPLERDERGCPRLAGGIAYTSLSHADGLIAVAVTTSGPVGVDIEPATRAAVMSEIAQCVCHRSEAAELAALDEPARGAALLAIWVRKEAVLKAAGVGLEVPMDTFAAPEHQALALPAAWSDALQVRMLGTGGQCVAAVAGPPGIGVACRWLRPPIGSCAGDGPSHSRRGTDSTRLAVVEAW